MSINDIFTPEIAPTDAKSSTIVYPSQSQALIDFTKTMTPDAVQNMSHQERVTLASQLDTFLDDVASYKITFFKDSNNRSKLFGATMRAVNSVRNTLSRIDPSIPSRERKTSRDVASILTLGQKG